MPLLINKYIPFLIRNDSSIQLPRSLSNEMVLNPNLPLIITNVSMWFSIMQGMYRISVSLLENYFFALTWYLIHNEWAFLFFEKMFHFQDI